MIYYKSEQLQAKDYILVNPAEADPVTLEEVKLNSRIDGNEFDSQIFSLIKVATEYGEMVTGRDFINKTYKCFLNCLPAASCRSIEIRKSKLQSIISIQYYSDGVLTTFDSSKYYITESNTFSKIYLKDGEFWPTTDRRPQAIIINFIAGYGEDSCSVPDAIKRAILGHIELLRAEAGDCGDSGGVSKQVMQLYAPFVLITKRFVIV